MNVLIAILYLFARSLQIVGAVGLSLIFIFPITAFAIVTMDQNEVTKVEIAKVHEFYFADVCPRYRDASTYDKWFDHNTKELSWCEDYIDRL